MADVTKPVSMGTTIIGFKYADGVLVCADSRTSSDTRIANRVQRKIIQLNERCLVCCSGAAADTRFLCRAVRENIQQHELQLEGPAQIRTIANLFSLFNHKYKEILLAGLLVCGVDDLGFHCFKVLPGGTTLEQDLVSSGSGSTYVMGLMDAEYQSNMSEEEAVAFARKLVRQAVYRDGSSGGVFRFALVGPAGVRGDVDAWEQVV